MQSPSGQISHGIAATILIAISCSVLILSQALQVFSWDKSPLDSLVLLTLLLVVTLPCISGIIENIPVLRNISLHHHFQVFLLSISVLITYYICYGYLHTSRRMAIQVMQEAFVVFDKLGHLVDINQRAISLFQPSPDAPKLTRSLFAQCLQVPDGSALNNLQEHEFRLYIDGVSRWFSASFFKISNSINQHCADGFIVREITEFMEEMDKLNDMATVDALTQVRNRRYLNEHASVLMRSARKSQQPITLLVFDLDKFKNINDTYGHHIGDKVLILVCDLCKHALRKSDELFRIGGEEFVIICRDTNESSGELLAERIRSIIESTPLITEDGHVIKITISIGGGSFVAEDGDTLERWLQLADERLYLAKQSGRNRVAFFHAIDSKDWFVG
jgi:diguanylate cyclase (GGDEF)-like protein